MKKLMLSLALSGLMLTGFAQEKKDLKSDTKEMTAPLHKRSKDKKHDGLKIKILRSWLRSKQIAWTKS
ncbi:hypothetical protein KUH03_09865 [Sphingobacterium sp. E70]|uniref:hypothetical protein n=1 Tax=Sphingobacterium sp. E70 TaxID=2853439 RepID=UPI00211CE010|nr:hypothetical protein [Sphingobacterium sp. E70]ULT27057.1 hypothetical protein KUH03_09865 [Sphingobacterium sp. E70]